MISARRTELGEYVRTQFQSIGALHYLFQAMLSDICFLSEATNLGVKLPREKVLNGTYHDLPERFQKLKETADRIFVKNE